MTGHTFHQSDNAEAYRTNANFVYNDENTREVVKLLDPQPGDMILDVGCGTGELSRRIHGIVSAGSHAQTGNRGCVVGVDAAATMIQAAQEKNTAAGLAFHVCDGHDLERWLEERQLTGKFDKVFSNAALHWMKRSPLTVVQGMSAALKPNGQLAIEMGGHLNVVGVRSSLHGALAKRGVNAASVDPWYFPTPEAYSALLQQTGLRPTTAYLYPRPTPLPRESGLTGWLQTFAGPFVNALPEGARRQMLDEVEEQARVDMYDQDNDQWTVMYVRTRAQAIKEERM